MDSESFEQIVVSEESIGDRKKFLLENLEVTIVFYKGAPISIELPVAIESKVIKGRAGSQRRYSQQHL